MPLIDLDTLEAGPIDAVQGNAYETSALPGAGDTNAGGGGLTASSMTNEADLAAYGLDTYSQSNMGKKYVSSGGNLHDARTGQHVGKTFTPTLTGTAADHPYVTIGLVIAILLLMKFVPKGGAESEDSKNVKISITNGIRIGLISSLFILTVKLLFGVWNIASVSPTVEFL